MRQVTFSDVFRAARVLLLVPSGNRITVLETIIHQAELADRFRKRTGKPHLDWGNGTLASAAHRFRAAVEPSVSEPDFAMCLAMVLARISRIGHKSSTG